ncbi:MAG: hypothetical protein M1820_001419 [Bogoriella megaspora]|nr:MAG: hypothetical protein M1820_001419 [Bogoriella megaspora]
MEAGEAQPVEARNPTYLQKLSKGENLWAWKLGLRVILLIVAIIGIGCIGWALSTSMNSPISQYTYYDGDLGGTDWTLPWGLITLPLSFIFCTICVAVLLLRKRPVHPGVAVGFDLILWLALIVTTIFTAGAAYNTSITSSSNGYIQAPYGGGRYLQAQNGTWVWNATSSSGYDSYDSYGGYYYSNDDDNSETRDCTPAFDSCQAEDAYVNKVLDGRTHKQNVEWTAVACQAIAVLIHFALFVWACCDTHKRNSAKTTDKAEQIAEKIIQDMTNKGQIIPMQQPLLARQSMAPPQTAPGTARSEAEPTINGADTYGIHPATLDHSAQPAPGTARYA